MIGKRNYNYMMYCGVLWRGLEQFTVMYSNVLILCQEQNIERILKQ
jgi:hypothetical protein